MKLIYCKACQDVFRLTLKQKTCECGRSSGKYLPDGLRAVYSGPATPLGFHNTEFLFALQHQPQFGLGERFLAFVIPENCDTMKKVETVGKNTKRRKSKR